MDDWPGVRAPIGGTKAPAAWGLGAASLAGLGAAVLTTGPAAVVGAGVAALGAWEAGWWLRRRGRRTAQFARARADANATGRPLVVIGAPDGGSTAGYPCGDFTVDLSGSSCPNTIVADITKPMPFADDSVVVFCSAVLEYVEDVNAAIAEIERISGGHAFFVGVEPFTLAARFYPGARRTLPAAYR